MPKYRFDPEKTIYLIDGSAFLYRAYYGTRPLHTSKGVPVQAVYSFCRMIKKLMDSFSPSYMALVWDSKGPTERHEIYEAYKATRQAPPSDLFMQKEYIVQFAELIGLYQLEKQGREADDILYSLAQERARDGDTVILVTSDKDMGQTLSDSIFMYDAFKDVVIDRAAFQEKMGFSPDKLSFYFALLGDSSDNIPGVKGIGEKGATQLVQQFASLDDLYQNLEAVEKNKTREALQTQKEAAYLSEQLFLLRYEPTLRTKQDLTFSTADWSNARPLFLELDFKSLLKDVGAAVPLAQKMASMAAYNFIAITTEQAVADLATAIMQAKECALDTEGSGLNPWEHEMVGISFCMKEGTAYYVPFGHKVEGPQLSRDVALRYLKPVLEDGSIKKYLHNAKFDQRVLLHAGITMRGFAFDTMLAANILTEEWQRVGLKYLSEFYFNETMISFDDIVTKQKRKDFSYVPIDEATQYSACDAHQTFRLMKLFEHELEQKPVFKRLLYDIEFPLHDVLMQMESDGVFLEVGLLERLGKTVGARLIEIEDELLSSIGKKFAGINLNSPKQVAQLLFEELQLPPQKKSAKGSYSTDQEVLETLQHLHPVPGLILKYRELFKLKSTYIDALPLHVNSVTGKIHTTFSQVGVATGRLASYDPNVQNIPASGLGLEIRAAFKPEDGHLFISADYSQIELRVLAHYSNDPVLIEAFLHEHDIHAETAARLFRTTLHLVTHEQRQVGKRINFSILYGLTPFGLSKDLGIRFKEAKLYIDTYFEQYPRVAAWMDEVIEETKKHGYVETYWGRRRYIPTIYEKNRALYEEAKRIAVNTKAQGTAAEIMKLGMIALSKAFKENNLDAHMVFQIHDELLISADREQVDTIEQVVKRTLESVVQWQIPLKVTTRTGSDWKDVTK